MSPQALLGLLTITGVALIGLSRWRSPERRRRDRGTSDSTHGSNGDGWSSDRDGNGDGGGSDSGGGDGGGE